MANKFQLKRSAVASKVPTTTDLDLGELAINTYDGKLFLKKNNGTESIVEIGGGGGGGGGSGALYLTYDNRGEMRAINGPADQMIVVEGLGTFQWEAGSTEPDDDETAFATTGGRWLLSTVSFDTAFSYWYSELEHFSGRFITAYATNPYSSINANSTVFFDVNINEVDWGDGVIITPPAGIDTNGIITAYAWVLSDTTVRIVLRNGTAAAVSLNAAANGSDSPWTVIVIKEP